MPGTSRVAEGPTVMVALERRGIRSWKRSLAQRDLAALGRERAHRQALDVARRHLDVEGEAAPHVDAVGAGDAHGERGQADLAGLELEGLALALAGAERDGALEAGLRLAAGLGLVGAGDGVGAGRAFDVVDRQLQPGLVAQRQEARPRDGERHGIAHDHVLARPSRPCRRSRPRRRDAPCR